MRKSSTGSASVSKRQRKELNSPLLKVLGTWQREGDRPTRVRTWASKGQTPVIQFHFNWKHISVIAGVSHTQCLLRMYEGSIKKEHTLSSSKRCARI